MAPKITTSWYRILLLYISYGTVRRSLFYKKDPFELTRL